MSKSNVFRWLILGGWMAASTWWHVCKIKLLCEPVLCEPIRYQRPDSPLSIQDGDRFSVTSQKNISFALSEEKPNWMPLQHLLDSLASYLRANRIES
ncbi:hypothetical protein [Dyadobacter sp. 22481]|uniref:hypothetical protein n=1 Tax=Dyadobacter sp. 22481 TaxID=3453926 RepID=UPI003F87F395